MSNYAHPSDVLADILIDDGLLENGNVFVDNRPEWTSVNPDYDVITILRMTTAQPNPRWLRDTITCTIQVMGRTNQDQLEARNHTWDVFNKLLGRDTFTRDNYTYLQFVSQEMPTFVGYLENGTPLYTCSITFVREAQVKEGNRDVLC